MSMENFIEEENKKWIGYFDANNLYGGAMVKRLPYSNYKWGNPEEFNLEKIMNIEDEGDDGYIFEVDLQYPEELHDLHNDYPLAVEKLSVSENMLSEYNKNTLKQNSLKHVVCDKLVPNLMDKIKYITHFKNLKFYLSSGLKLSKIHHVLTFTQKAWMKPYIEFNTNQRKQAKNAFEKDFYKLMNNSVFGKTMEDVRCHMNSKICTNMKQKDRVINNPRFKKATIWDEEYGFFEMNKKQLNKPISTGFSILELSKITMYNYHYNYILPKYGNNAKLLFTDTDSLCYEIITDDLFQDMKNDSYMYDLSEFPKDFKTKNGTIMYDETNKKVLEKMKLETGTDIPIELVGLRSKLYSLLLDDGKDKKTCKGIKKCVKDFKIKHQNYKETLMKGDNMNVSQRTIRSYNHEVYSIETNKIALSSVNDKRYMINNIDSYSYGHYKIGNNC